MNFMIKRLIRKIFPKKLIVKKSGLRTHINERKKLIKAGKNEKFRFYENKIGEKFKINRKMLEESPDLYFIKINGINNKINCEGLYFIDKLNREIGIENIKILNYDNTKKGREIFRMFLDEAIQIGINQFKTNYAIILTPENKQIEKYYEKFGFKRDENNNFRLEVKKC